MKRAMLGLLFVLLPSVALAQPVQENYLPFKSQLYFRWDGMDKHQADFDKTAVGKMMQGETGAFMRSSAMRGPLRAGSARACRSDTGCRRARLLRRLATAVRS